MRELSICEVSVVSGGGNGDDHSGMFALLHPATAQAKSLSTSADMALGVGLVGIGAALAAGGVLGVIGAGVAAGGALAYAYDAARSNIGGGNNVGAGGYGGARSDQRGSTGTAGTSNGDGHGF